MPDSLPLRGWHETKTQLARRVQLHLLEANMPNQPGKSTSSRFLRIVLALVLLIVITTPAYSDQASSAYNRGVRSEAQVQYDDAFEAFSEAHRLKPKDVKYMVAFLRVRGLAAEEHVRKGQLLRINEKLQEASVEFQRGAEIDPTNYAAQQEWQRTQDMIN